MQLSLPTLLALSALAATASAGCNCGNTINATNQDHWLFFTEVVETDFTSHAAAEGLARSSDSSPSYTNNYKTDWLAQTYTMSPKVANGPYGKSFQGGNVVLDPSAKDPGLQLWVKSSLFLNDTQDDQGNMEVTSLLVPSSEVVSNRSDILYGSFRIGMKATAVNGTCGAFFFYKNDSHEIDMEILSHQRQEYAEGQYPINLVLQSPQSVDQGYNAQGTPGFQLFNFTFDPAEKYHDYRFDWLPSQYINPSLTLPPRVDFYVDGNWLWTSHASIPSTAGHIHFSHWSNGKDGWSAGPPMQDAVITVSYVKMYFNSSEPKLAVGCTEQDQLDARSGCPLSDGPAVQPTPAPTGVSTVIGTGSTATATSTPKTQSRAAGRLLVDDSAELLMNCLAIMAVTLLLC